MKKAFATNLRKARKVHGWNQFQAAKAIGIERATYQAYEEGRSMPRAEGLITMADTFGVTNLLAFMTNEHFDFRNQDALPIRPKIESPLQANYAIASPRDKKLVNAILGIEAE